MAAVTPEAKRARKEADRARKAADREARKAAGLTRLEIWARPENHAAIRCYAVALEEAREKPGRILPVAYNDGKI